MAIGLLNVSDTTTAYNKTSGITEKIVSDHLLYIFQVVVYVTLIGVVSLCGIVANVINIVVFVKQGLLSDSSNVSLCGLAVADLWCLLSLSWMSVLWFIIVTGNHSTSWNPQDVIYLTAGYPYFTFSNTACTISAYIAFERCMCVMFPFKVKNLFTPRRSFVVMICIYSYFILSVIPIFITLQLRWTRDPKTNDSVLILYSLKHHKVINEIIIIYGNSIGVRTFAALVIIVCTHIIAYKVRSSWKWRKSATKTVDVQNTQLKLKTRKKPVSRKENPDLLVKNEKGKENQSIESKTQTRIGKDKPQIAEKMSSKETTLIKMITAISTIFIICCTPDILISYAKLIEKEFEGFGKYRNLFYLLYSIKFLMESVNSSVNIFVYYSMSTRYRNVLKAGFEKIVKNF